MRRQRGRLGAWAAALDPDLLLLTAIADALALAWLVYLVGEWLRWW